MLRETPSLDTDQGRPSIVSEAGGERGQGGGRGQEGSGRGEERTVGRSRRGGERRMRRASLCLWPMKQSKKEMKHKHDNFDRDPISGRNVFIQIVWS